jgi:CBS domain-containing protein
MRVQDIMERNFAIIQADDGLDSILEVFSTKHVSSALVLAKGELSGVLSCSDLARLFLPREGAQSDVSGITASVLAKKSPFTLTPDQPVKLALAKIAASSDCIPVMDGKKVVGVVRPESAVDFYLAELAKVEVVSKKAIGAKDEKANDSDNATTLDNLLELVRRDGKTTPKKVAKELGITESTAEDLAKILGKHKLIDINYSFMTGMVMRRMEHGGK